MRAYGKLAAETRLVSKTPDIFEREGRIVSIRLQNNVHMERRGRLRECG
jgi:hypothetical protein